MVVILVCYQTLMLIAKTEGKLFYETFGMDGLCIYLFSMKTKLFILTIFFLVYFKLFKKEKKEKKRYCYFIAFVVSTIYFVSLRFASPFLIRFRRHEFQ